MSEDLLVQQGKRGMGRLQMHLLRDLVVEGEWRRADHLETGARQLAILRTLEPRGMVRIIQGDHISDDLVYGPTEAADQWFIRQGHWLRPPGGIPFVYCRFD